MGIGAWFSGLKARANRPTWGVLAIYAALTLALTYPTVLNLSTAIVGFPGEDNIYSVWEGWWFKVALLDWHASPANVPLLYHPLGLYQTMLTATPWTELTQAPLVAVFDPVVAYNVIFLLSFFLTAFFTYLLCYDLTGNRWAALAGGFIFAFSPFRTIHAAAGHFTQSMTYWFPLYAVFMLRVVRKPTARDAVLAGVFMALSALVSLMHIAYFVIPFTVAVLFYGYLSDRTGFLSRDRIRYLALALATGAVITAPFFLPFLQQRLGGNWNFLDRTGTVDYAVDPVAFLSPSPYHPLFSRLPIEPFLQKVIYGFPFEDLVYLGWIPLALAWFGRKGATARLWLWLGVVTGILSLGPMLKFAGQLITYQVENLTAGVLLPYALIKKLPLYEMGRTPARLVEPLMLCLAVMAALGLARLWQTLEGRRGRVAVTALLLGGILFEYITLWPLPQTPAPRPSFYQEIASDGQDYAILDVPILSREVLGYSMYYQTIHHHPIVGGYLWRFPVDAMNMMEFMSALTAAPISRDIVSAESDVPPKVLVSRYNIRYVTLHKGEYESAGHEQIARDTFTHEWGPPVFEDERIAIFRTRRVSGGVEGINFAAVGPGWQPPELWDGGATRWLSDQGSLFYLRAVEGQHQLRFNAYPYLRNRTVDIEVNGKPVDTVVVGTWQEVLTKPFPLRDGLNAVQLTVREGCEKPADAEGKDDSRCLSIAVQNVVLVP